MLKEVGANCWTTDQQTQKGDWPLKGAGRRSEQCNQGTAIWARFSEAAGCISYSRWVMMSNMHGDEWDI